MRSVKEIEEDYRDIQSELQTLRDRLIVLEGEDNHRIDHIEEVLHLVSFNSQMKAAGYVRDHIPRPNLSEENE